MCLLIDCGDNLCLDTIIFFIAHLELLSFLKCDSLLIGLFSNYFSAAYEQKFWLGEYNRLPGVQTTGFCRRLQDHVCSVDLNFDLEREASREFT